MTSPQIEIRHVKESELEEAQRVEDEAWGALTGTLEDLQNVFQTFPDGFFTAFVDGRAAGNVYSCLLDYDLNHPIPSWAKATGSGSIDNHNPNGDTVMTVALGVAPQYRGAKLGSLLIQRLQAMCVVINHASIVLGARIPFYHKYP